MTLHAPILTLLRGLGQIMLQENAATGLLFLAGITIGSPVMGLAALLAVASGTLTATMLRYRKAEVEQGLYGFSAALVGVALVLFRGHGPWVWMAVGTGSAVAAVIQHYFLRRKVPVFTLPFVLVTWAALLLLPAPGEAAAVPPSTLPGGMWAGALVHGFGQVIFQDGHIAGLLFLVAVALHSRIAALYGMAGASLAAGLALCGGADGSAVGSGLWSFNAVLCAIACSGTKPRNLLLLLFSVPLAVLIGQAMQGAPVPQLTFPFVAATCLSLLVEHLVQLMRKRRGRGGMRPAA